VVCSLIVASAAAGGGVVFSRGGDAGRGSASPRLAARESAARDARATSRYSAPAVTGPAATGPALTAAGVARVPKHAPAMPPDYDVLLRRSIFGLKRPAGGGGRGEAAEARWVLRGVLLQEGHFTAFLEDVSARTLRKLRAGDPVAGGRLESVSFDGLAYQAAGVLTHVDIGQDLSGNTAPPPTTSPAGPPTRKPSAERADKGERGDKGDKRDKGEGKDRPDDGESGGSRRREK
jgi:hypothetical protein